MLSRACRPLLRQRALALPIQSSIPAFQSRRYAHNNKRSPTHNDNKTPSSKPPNQRSGFDGPSRPPPKQRDFSEEQVEFEHNETSKQNTPPKTTGAGPSLNRGKPERASSESEFSETQAEFETSSTPQSESGNEHATPKYPLPDLTKGIPSTIGAEMDALSRKQGSTPLNLTEDPTKLPEDELARAGAGGGGGVPKDSYVSSTDRRRNRLMLWAGYFLLANVLGGTLYMGRPWESEEEAKAHPNSLWFFQRIRARYVDFWKYYSDPAFEKLLPDGDPQYRPPYTLVLSLNDLLVHDEWSREHGWRTAKRPGVDYFLRYLSQYYELVLFTSAPSMIADLTLRSLDPFHIIQWPLFREATKYESGHYVKVCGFPSSTFLKLFELRRLTVLNEGFGISQPGSLQSDHY
jgi:import inner membrane translocase subunit TIM50